MTEIRKQIHAGVDEARKAQARKLVDDKTIGQLQKALFDIWAYLDSNKDSKEPLDYKFVSSTIGKLNRVKVLGVLDYALRDRT